jgi:hypothetical protein
MTIRTSASAAAAARIKAALARFLPIARAIARWSSLLRGRNKNGMGPS